MCIRFQIFILKGGKLYCENNSFQKAKTCINSQILFLQFSFFFLSYIIIYIFFAACTTRHLDKHTRQSSNNFVWLIVQASIFYSVLTKLTLSHLSAHMVNRLLCEKWKSIFLMVKNFLKM